MKFSAWIGLLARNRFDIAPSKLGLALSITFSSILNSVLQIIQELVFFSRIKRTKLNKPPVFIIGHWRSGTTLLHELMVLDERFSYANTHQCMAPCHFLLTSKIMLRLTFLLPKRRPMDQMAVGWKLPQEDEFALVNLGQPSPYQSIAFPEGQDTKGALSLEGLSETQRENWKKSLMWFLRRVSLQTNKTLVIKSPPHTARVKTLLEMFPKAKFIFVVRDPYEVFHSTLKLWSALRQSQSLQTSDNHDLKARVLSDFETMFEAFERDRNLIPQGQFYETRFENFIDNPVGEMARLYNELDLGEFEQSRSAIEDYFARRSGYKKDSYELSSKLQREIDQRWGPFMRKYGYCTQENKTGMAYEKTGTSLRS